MNYFLKNKYSMRAQTIKVCLALLAALCVQEARADVPMKAYHFADGGTEFAGVEGDTFLCITRNSIQDNADDTVDIMTNGDESDFVVSSTKIKGKDSNQTFSILFEYNKNYYRGTMTRSSLDHDSFKLNLDGNSALGFLQAFKHQGKVSISAMPTSDLSPGPSNIIFSWPTFNRDMLHQQACEEAKGHISGAISESK
ncbi:hypothetical protein LV564_01315 [Komagataeibacter nataicola]|uniref:hypothetical protein n=1 Tax=Komagataeibacter nataicola TaxID=265960 RepID=UPI0023DD364E|nr:hypothetical protein [Komagataeibacter nataicola]WEQ55782.1 hypothetical protein LV564_01315 [Komagataeibacter nataicola]